MHRLRVFWIALRPYSLPASLMPALIGAVGAWRVSGAFSPVYLVLTGVGVALIHACGNLVNDAFDHARGIDREVIPVSGAVVRGLLTSSQALTLAAYCAIGGAGVGIYLTLVRGPLVAVLGLAGLFLAVSYTAPPLSLKYRGVGDLVILLAFGIGVAVGSWLVQAGRLTWTPVVWGLPQAMLIVGILHANNWRDVGRDRDLGARSLAQRLGERGSFWYFVLLTAGPVVLTAAMPLISRAWSLTPPLPWTCLLVLGTVPQVVRLLRIAWVKPREGNPPPFVVLDAATARLALTFGLLFSAGLVLGKALH